MTTEPTDELLETVDAHTGWLGRAVASDEHRTDNWQSADYLTQLAAALREARTERDDLKADVYGCACPAPYTECPHDEPLVDQLAEARGDRDALRTLLADAVGVVREAATRCKSTGVMPWLAADLDALADRLEGKDTGK